MGVALGWLPLKRHARSSCAATATPLWAAHVGADALDSARPVCATTDFAGLEYYRIPMIGFAYYMPLRLPCCSPSRPSLGRTSLPMLGQAVYAHLLQEADRYFGESHIQHPGYKDFLLQQQHDYWRWPSTCSTSSVWLQSDDEPLLPIKCSPGTTIAHLLERTARHSLGQLAAASAAIGSVHPSALPEKELSAFAARPDLRHPHCQSGGGWQQLFACWILRL